MRGIQVAFEAFVGPQTSANPSGSQCHAERVLYEELIIVRMPLAPAGAEHTGGMALYDNGSHRFERFRPNTSAASKVTPNPSASLPWGSASRTICAKTRFAIGSCRQSSFGPRCCSAGKLTVNKPWGRLDDALDEKADSLDSIRSTSVLWLLPQSA